MPFDSGPMFARQRALFDRADQQRGELWNRISETVTTLKQQGAKPFQIGQALAPLMEPMRKLTMSSGRDESHLPTEVAWLISRPLPQKPQETWSFADNQGDHDVHRYTAGMAIAASPELKQAFADRLQQALQQKG